MHGRVGGTSCPWLTLEEVVSRDSTSPETRRRPGPPRRGAQQGDRQRGRERRRPAVFDHVMQKLRAAWRLLRDAGVRRFVFTSDHGFLLLDETAALGSTHGRKIDPKRRHVFSAHGADHSGEVRVALARSGLRGRRGARHVPGDDGGLRHRAPLDELRPRRQQPAGARHPGADGRPPRGRRWQHGPLLGSRVGARRRRRDALPPGAGRAGRPGSLRLRRRRRRWSSRSGCRRPRTSGWSSARCAARRASWAAHCSPRSGRASSSSSGSPGPRHRRVQVELFHGSQRVEVTPCVPDARFAVAATRTSICTTAACCRAHRGRAVGQRARGCWTSRRAASGRCSSTSPFTGQLRRAKPPTCSAARGPCVDSRRDFEEFAQKAPFCVRIDMVAGFKRYVREGNSQ